MTYSMEASSRRSRYYDTIYAAIALGSNVNLVCMNLNCSFSVQRQLKMDMNARKSPPLSDFQPVLVDEAEWLNCRRLQPKPRTICTMPCPFRSRLYTKLKVAGYVLSNTILLGGLGFHFCSKSDKAWLATSILLVGGADRQKKKE